MLARKATSRRPAADLLHMLDIICAGSGCIGVGEGTVQGRVGGKKITVDYFHVENSTWSHAVGAPMDLGKITSVFPRCLCTYDLLTW